MASIGGSIISVSVDGRLFSVAADADAKRNLGGRETEVEMNGDGTPRYVMTAVSWEVGGLTLSIDEQGRGQQHLQSVQAKLEEVVMTFTFGSGFTYRGKGKLIGKVEFNSKNSTAEVAFSGGGELEQQ